MSGYTIDRGLGVRERMDLLAGAHAPGTAGLLDLLGVTPGARCVDLGCGGGHVRMELARRAGPSGTVVGIDLDEELLQLAREEAAAQGLDNVTFRVAPVEQFSDTDWTLRTRGCCCPTCATRRASSPGWPTPCGRTASPTTRRR